MFLCGDLPGRHQDSFQTKLEPELGWKQKPPRQKQFSIDVWLDDRFGSVSMLPRSPVPLRRLFVVKFGVKFPVNFQCRISLKFGVAREIATKDAKNCVT